MTPFAYDIAALQADPKVHQEEIRRAIIGESASNRLGFMIEDLLMLREKDLRQMDPIKALITTGVKLLELGYHTKGRLRAAEGRGDAFLEATAANVKTGLRQALSTIDEHDIDPGAWDEAFELIKPVMEDCRDIAKKMERPGVKTAILPAVPDKPKPEPGPRLLEEDGAPAAAAEIAEPEPRPAVAPLQTLGYTPDVDAQDAEIVEDEFDTWSEEERAEEFKALLDQLEVDGVEEGLKRRDWAKAKKAWDEAIAANPKDAYARLCFAANYRIPTSWEIPTDEEFQAYDEKLARAAGEE